MRYSGATTCSLATKTIACCLALMSLCNDRFTVHGQGRGGIQHGGGGNRGGNFGGGGGNFGGGQPNFGGGNFGGNMGGGRPSMPNIQTMPSSRPSFGNASGGGFGGSGFGGNGQPITGQVVRPNNGNGNQNGLNTRPTYTPSLNPNMPSMGANRPSLGGYGNSPTTITKPSFQNVPGVTTNTRPNFPNNNVRPSVRPAPAPTITNKPSTLPGIDGSNPGTRPNIQPPSIGGITRPPKFPGNDNRPNNGGNDRPNIGANRPFDPDFNNNGRPGIGGNRPTTLPGTINRPGIGDNRPTTLPGIVTRPGIGGPGSNTNNGGNGNGWAGSGIGNPWSNNHVNRPNIGNGGFNGNNVNRPNFGNNNFVGNNNNTVNINRPGWDNDHHHHGGWGVGPNYGYGNNNWHNNWNNNCINPHYHGWYNGGWSGYWGSAWYAPIAWGGLGWGLGSYTSTYYGSGFYTNPYYYSNTVGVSSLYGNVPYNYSQPVVINSYIPVDASNDPNGVFTAPNNLLDTSVSPQAPDSDFTKFDEGLAAFKTEQYNDALSAFNEALDANPRDPVIHELRALTLFALGEYRPAAEALNSLLASAPGMNWTTMSSLYRDVTVYTAQLRKLESFCKKHPTDAAPYFVLAYHYLVTGSKDAAIIALKNVVANQPDDLTAKRMLESLTTGNDVPSPMSDDADTDIDIKKADDSSVASEDNDNQPETDLVGEWTAKAGDATIELEITESSKFKWRVTEEDKPSVTMTGKLNASADAIQFESVQQGTLGGKVISEGPDQWRMIPPGVKSANDGITFVRRQ